MVVGPEPGDILHILPPKRARGLVAAGSMPATRIPPKRARGHQKRGHAGYPTHASRSSHHSAKTGQRSRTAPSPAWAMSKGPVTVFI